MTDENESLPYKLKSKLLAGCYSTVFERSERWVVCSERTYDCYEQLAHQRALF